MSHITKIGNYKYSLWGNDSNKSLFVNEHFCVINIGGDNEWDIEFMQDGSDFSIHRTTFTKNKSLADINEDISFFTNAIKDLEDERSRLALKVLKADEETLFRMKLFFE